MSAFDVKFDKNINFGGYFSQNPSILGQNPYIFDAKTDPFIPFGDNSVEYLEHIGFK